jgi:glucosamine--fructose-6-phosphate aminotransferase (isomerizing)
MCGILAYISKNGHGPSLKILRALAITTEQRGHHAFGLAWTNGDTIETFKRPGAATDALEDLELCRHATAMVGHCRWATHGTPEDNRNNHPHAAGRGQLVHNGVVRNYRDLAYRYALERTTDCDSEVLGLLIGTLRGRLLERGAQMAREAQGDLAVLGLWAGPTRLLVVRDTRPLHYGETKDGLYFASLPEGLPGRPWAVRDHSALVVTAGEQGLRITRQTIECRPEKTMRIPASQRLLFG